MFNMELMDTEHIIRLAMIRLMLEHREISVADLAKVMNSSERTLYYLISAASHRGSAPRRIREREELLNALETTITTISDARGGVPKMCCSESALQDYRDVLSQEGREEFSRAW